MSQAGHDPTTLDALDAPDEDREGTHHGHGYGTTSEDDESDDKRYSRPGRP
jgi:hypothetical protein